MFQQIFRAQSEDVLVWPLIALVIFMAVFTVRVVAVMLQDQKTTEAQSRLPLEDDRHA